MDRKHIDIKQAFTTESHNTQMLFENKFLIPGYQRPYSWGEQSILRLFTDIYQCINELEKPNSNSNEILTFLGTIITVGNSSSTSDLYKANEYFSIIDGQQRISTFSLITAVLCEKAMKLIYKLHFLYPSVTEENGSEFEKQILSRLLTIYDILIDMLRQTSRNGEGKHYYPRLVRTGMDSIKLTNNSFLADMKSALGAYLKEMIQKLVEPIDFLDKIQPNLWDTNQVLSSVKKEVSSGSTWKFIRDTYELPKNVVNQDPETASQYETIKKAVACINNILNFICEAQFFYSEDESIHKKIPKSLLSSYKDLSENFEFSNLGKHQLSELTKQFDDFYFDEHDQDTVSLAKDNDFFLIGTLEFLLFAETFIYRLVVTMITATNENYAFSMFDSLNTTGEALTAYETFKAKIVNAEGSCYMTSQVRQMFKKMDIFLNGNSQEEKKSRTVDVLISFARASDGTTLSPALNAERVYLNNLSEQVIKDPDARYSLVQHLYICCRFWEDIWNSRFTGNALSFIIKNANGQQKTVTCSADVTLGLSMLKNSNHKVVTALLIKYYSFFYYCFDDLDLFDKAKQLFFSAVKAVTAFSTIYRSAHSTTAGIEAKYKDLFSDKVLPHKMYWFLEHGFISSSDSNLCKGAAVTLDEVAENLEAIKRKLIYVLEKKDIAEFDKWQSKAKECNIYESNKSIARFMICVDWAVEDSHHPEISNTLLETLAKNNSIEHVAPQNPKGSKTDKLQKSGWDMEIYNKNLQESLGNLLLVHPSVNSLLSNRSWSEKKDIYIYFSEAPESKKEEALSKLEPNVFEKGTLLKHQAEGGQILVNKVASKYAWTAEVVEKRTETMTKNIWDFLHLWLFNK